MKVGDRVKHMRLGEGVVYSVGKYGCLINFSNKDGVLFRGSKFENLELIEDVQNDSN